MLTNAASNHMSSRTFYPVSMSDPRLSENDFDYNVLEYELKEKIKQQQQQPRS